MVTKIIIILVAIGIIFYLRRIGNGNKNKVLVETEMYGNLKRIISSVNGSAINIKILLSRYTVLNETTREESQLIFANTLRQLNDILPVNCTEKCLGSYKFNSYYSKKIRSLVDVSMMISSNLNEEKSSKIINKFTESFGYLLQEKAIIDILEDTFPGEEIIKLSDLYFSENFNFFTDLILIVKNTIIVVLDEKTNFNFSEFHSYLNTLITTRINIEIFHITTYSNALPDASIIDKSLLNKLDNVIKNISKNKNHGANKDTNIFLANILINMSKNMELNLVDELSLDYSDFTTWNKESHYL